MTDLLNARLLVTGASGHLGRLVVSRLLDAGARHVVAASRNPSALTDLSARGATLRRLDFDDASSLPQAFEGIDQVLLISTDAIAEPGLRLRQHLAAVEAIAQAGVGHLVYTSMPRPDEGSPIPFAPDHAGTEQAILRSGVSSTILRVSWYMENLAASLPQIIEGGRWFTSAGEGRVAYVAREDVAAVAAAALTSRQVSGCHDVTGPDAWSVPEVAALAGELFDRPIEVVNVGDDELARGLAAAGVPPHLVPLLVAFDANTRMDRVSHVSDTVPSLLGRPAQRLADFFAANRALLTGRS